MKYGIREVCDMAFYDYKTGIHAFTIDTAKTATLESSATIVYAQGGRGNSRLMAWEGERTLTFTVEDALLTPESFKALCGAKAHNATEKSISIRTDSFGGIYKIIASTLVRDENGDDIPAIIEIHRAKLQSNLNIPFSPTGDPVAFSFVFDAFPVDQEFATIQSNMFESLNENNPSLLTTVIIIDQEGKRHEKSVSTTAAIKIQLDTDRKIQVTLGAGSPVSFDNLQLTTNQRLSINNTVLGSTAEGLADTVAILQKGSITVGYIV